MSSSEPGNMDQQRKIGRYILQREIGRGGMAVVYLAFDPHFERQVAIKVMPRELLIDPSFLARFKREAKIIASLEHPAIVPVYDYGEEQSQPYLVMRYMPGGTLEDRLNAGHLSLQEVCRLFDRLAPALDEAHSHGIVHRDLKPGNILFDQRGEPYLADFGIVKLAQATTTLTIGTIIGTPAYMSPEQGLGKKDIDGHADIYSLGAILFHLLTGRVPYEAETPTGQIMMHITEPVPDILAVRPDLPLQIQTIINHSMAKRPEERYNSVTELAEALVGLAAEKGEPVGPEAQLPEVVEKLPASPKTDVDRTLKKDFLTEYPQETDLSSKKEGLEHVEKPITPAKIPPLPAMALKQDQPLEAMPFRTASTSTGFSQVRRWLSQPGRGRLMAVSGIILVVMVIIVPLSVSWIISRLSTPTVTPNPPLVMIPTPSVTQTAKPSATATLEAITSMVKPMTFMGVPTDMVKLDSGLQYIDLVVGTGQESKKGDFVSVHYTGWLTDGTKFDSSVDRGQPFDFSVGAGNVIKGWDDGVVGMRIGGSRILVIPPNMAYGPQGQGSIPANATLVFEIVLLNIK